MPNFLDGVNKRGLITFGGVRSDDYGMVVSAAPSFDRPTRKQTVYNVPGRNGPVLFQEDAWNETTRVYNVWIDEDIQEDSGGNTSGTLSERINAFFAAINSLKGYQMLWDNFEPGFFRNAYYSGGDNFTNNMMAYGEATLTFTCRPERFLSTLEVFNVTNGGTIKNPTQFKAKPVISIKVTTPSTVTVSINGETVTAEVTDYIYIDCDEMNAYRQSAENMNNKISGVFPTLKPGNNTVVVTGSPQEVEIQPRWYTI